MNKIKCTGSNYEELVYTDRLEDAIYIDMNKLEIVVCDSDQEESDTLIKIPSQEELISENALLGEFIMDCDLDIPRGKSARGYLRENDLSGGFYGCQSEETVKALQRWLQERQIEIEFTA